MERYDKNDLFNESIKISMKKIKSWKSEVLNIAKINFQDSKQNQKKGIKIFCPKIFKEDILKNQQSVFLKEMNLYNSRNMIINLFENKNIKPSDFPYNAQSEPEPG